MRADAHGNLSVDAGSVNRRLVIFGCGYVGGEVARQAIARGLRVTAVTRNAGKAAALAALGARVHVADLAGDSWHLQIDGGADFAVNCVSSGGGGPAAYRHSYVEGMRSVLAWARKSAVGTLLYTSSTSVYSPPAGGAIPTLDETSPVEGGTESSAVLMEAENLVRRSTTDGVRRWFILRLAGIYGPGRHHLLDEIRSGLVEFAGEGSRHLNLIHRDDAASAIWSALTAPDTVAGEVFNVADEGAATKAEVVAWLAAKVGKRAPHFSGAASPGRRQPSDRIVSNAKLKRVLGWSPAFPTFREGYADILESVGDEV